MSIRRLLKAVSLSALTSCGVWPTACEFANDGEYYCWKNEYQDFCEEGSGRWHANTTCAELGYAYHCTADEVAPGIQDEWTVAEGCDRSEAPPAGIGPALAACEDATYGTCVTLVSGDATSFESECIGAGNRLVTSCSSGASRCTAASGTSAGSPVTIDIDWPSNFCSFPETSDIIYLLGTCESLGGSFAGDMDACCSGSTSPGPGGGAYCL